MNSRNRLISLNKRPDEDSNDGLIYMNGLHSYGSQDDHHALNLYFYKDFTR